MYDYSYIKGWFYKTLSASFPPIAINITPFIILYTYFLYG